MPLIMNQILIYQQSKIKIKLVLPPLSMARYCSVENRPYPLAFVLPTRIESMRHLAHECTIHMA